MPTGETFPLDVPLQCYMCRQALWVRLWYSSTATLTLGFSHPCNLSAADYSGFVYIYSTIVAQMLPMPRGEALPLA